MILRFSHLIYRKVGTTLVSKSDSILHWRTIEYYLEPILMESQSKESTLRFQDVTSREILLNCWSRCMRKVWCLHMSANWRSERRLKCRFLLVDSIILGTKSSVSRNCKIFVIQEWESVFQAIWQHILGRRWDWNHTSLPDHSVCLRDWISLGERA